MRKAYRMALARLFVARALQLRSTSGIGRPMKLRRVMYFKNFAKASNEARSKLRTV